jgi:SAM-dependent methyltransferase
VLPASANRILERVGEDALVLDVGGAARPFARADWVVDLRPYEQRGELGWDGDPAEQRFTADTWVQRDICDRSPWPFADRQFDFAVCSQTLEDVRDPVWVCAELQRVARAGYIEVPALAEELTYGVQGPWVGWAHHHWLVLTGPGRLEFVFKHHVVNRGDSHLPAGSVDGLAPEQRVQTVWWDGRLEARERFLATAEELDGFLRAIVAAHSRPPPPSAARSRPRRWLAAGWRRSRT